MERESYPSAVAAVISAIVAVIGGVVTLNEGGGILLAAFYMTSVAFMAFWFGHVVYAALLWLYEGSPLVRVFLASLAFVLVAQGVRWLFGGEV